MGDPWQFVASIPVAPHRTRISAAICLALTLGTIVNVFGLQTAHRQPLAAIAETFPGAPTPSAGALPQTGDKRLATSSAAPIVANADADLSLRTADVGRAAADLSVPETAPPDATLVASIQQELSDRGYAPGRINGKAGLITRSAIMAFEFDQHFQLTAEPSEELLRRILLGLEGAAGETPLPPSPKAAGIIHGAQLLLVRLGYDPGPSNAQLGDLTRKALRRFEADAGLLPKGRISGDVMSELSRRTHAHIEAYDEALAR